MIFFWWCIIIFIILLIIFMNPCDTNILFSNLWFISNNSIHINSLLLWWPWWASIYFTIYFNWCLLRIIFIFIWLLIVLNLLFYINLFCFCWIKSLIGITLRSNNWFMIHIFWIYWWNTRFIISFYFIIYLIQLFKFLIIVVFL